MRREGPAAFDSREDRTPHGQNGGALPVRIGTVRCHDTAIACYLSAADEDMTPLWQEIEPTQEYGR